MSWFSSRQKDQSLPGAEAGPSTLHRPLTASTSDIANNYDASPSSTSPIYLASEDTDYHARREREDRSALQGPPSSVYVYGFASALLAFGLGVKRGASKARLRFLAENAHRPPTTERGWYFYMKARNYQMIKAGGITGFKYATVFGVGTGSYALLDETVGWYRETQLGIMTPKGDSAPHEATVEEEGEGMSSWRRGEVQVYDGALAGGIMGLAISAIWRFPRYLVFRSIMMGLTIGGLESSLQILLARMKRSKAQTDTMSRTEEEAQLRAEEERLSEVDRRRLAEEGQRMTRKERKKLVGEMLEEQRLRGVANAASGVAAQGTGGVGEGREGEGGVGLEGRRGGGGAGERWLGNWWTGSKSETAAG